MGSEAAFLKARAMILLPVNRAATSRVRVAPAPQAVDVEQVLRACRKNGLKSKG